MKSFKNEFLLGGTVIGISLAFILIVIVFGLASEQTTIVIICVILMFLVFSRKGTRIDLKNKRIQEYTSTLVFLKFGKWYDASDYKDFQIGNKSSSGTVTPNIAMQVSYDVSSKAIYLRNKVNKEVVFLMKGELEEVKKISNILENDLLIPRKLKSKK